MGVVKSCVVKSGVVDSGVVRSGVVRSGVDTDVCRSLKGEFARSRQRRW